MKCNQCGYMNVPGAKCCSNCGAILDMNAIMEENKNKKMANILCGVSIACTCFPGMIESAIENLQIQSAPLALISLLMDVIPVVGIAILVYVRVKYPTNTFGKVLMWLYIIGFIILMVLFATSIIACGIALRSCGSIG